MIVFKESSQGYNREGEATYCLKVTFRKEAQQNWVTLMPLIIGVVILPEGLWAHIYQIFIPHILKCEKKSENTFNA